MVSVLLELSTAALHCAQATLLNLLYSREVGEKHRRSERPEPVEHGMKTSTSGIPPLC